MSPSGARGNRASIVAVLVFVLVIAVIAAIAPAAGQVTGEPDISLAVADNRVAAGAATTLEVSVVNRGGVDSGSEQGNVEAERRVMTARGLTLEPESDGPITVRSDTLAVGDVPTGVSEPQLLEIAVDADADPGTYRIPVRVRYAYTPFVSEGDSRTNNNLRESTTHQLTVVVDEDARFEVQNVTVPSPGDDGPLTLEVENTGEATATDAVIGLESLTGDLVVGTGEASTTFIEEWQPGETKTLPFRATVADDATVRALPVSLTANYTDENGVPFESRTRFGATPDPDQAFAFEEIDTRLRVAQDGEIRGTIVNEGPDPVENLVVTLEPPRQNVEVVESEIAIGRLDAGEAVDVRFDVEVASAARAGSRQFTLRPEYETAAGDTREDDPIRFRADIQPRRDVFDVEPRNATVAPGSTERVDLEVTNNRDETVTDVSAKLFASSPLGASDDEAYIDELEPGETAVVSFRVSAAGNAMTKDYPVSVDFQYVDAAGETRLTESYRVPVTVEERSGGFLGGLFGLAGAAVLVGVLLPVAIVGYRRRFT